MKHSLNCGIVKQLWAKGRIAITANQNERQFNLWKKVDRKVGECIRAYIDGPPVGVVVQ